MSQKKKSGSTTTTRTRTTTTRNETKTSSSNSPKTKTKARTVYSVSSSPSRVTALIGAIFLFWNSISLLAGNTSIMAILGGILGIVFSVFVLISLDILVGDRISIPYEGWVLLLFGLIIIVIFPIAGVAIASMLGGVLILLAGIIEMMADNHKITASVIVNIAGIVFIFIESIGQFGGDAGAIAMAIIGILIAIVIILTLPILNGSLKFYYQWWLMMILASFLVLAPSAPAPLGGSLVAVASILMIMNY